MGTLSEASVQALVTAGRAAWPTLAVPASAFQRRLERHLDGSDDRAEALARVRPDDFYLACACAEGDTQAIRCFEQRFGKIIDRAVSKFAKSEDKKDELRQLLRERLFVAPPGGEPRIASYTGQGFLENWVRVAATRAFLNAQRGKKIEPGDDDAAFEAMTDGRDLELGFLKAHYREAFKGAFAKAIARLEPSDRLVLRLTVLRGMSCDDLAGTLGVHRATAARRAARARQLLMDTTREELASALKLGNRELTSILHLVESNLNLSLSRLLPADGAGTDPPASAVAAAAGRRA